MSLEDVKKLQKNKIEEVKTKIHCLLYR